MKPHAGDLRAWLRNRYPALSDPENIVEEALVRVWQTRGREGVEAPKALLYTLARNLAMDELRRRQIVTIDGVAEMAELSVYADGATAAEAAATNQELEILTKANQSLPERCRQVLTLRKIYGLSQKDIAAQLGIAEHTVEAQVGLGMRRCAQFLAKHGLP